MECCIDFENEKFSLIDNRHLELLKKMLEPNPSNRISAKDALNHELFLPGIITDFQTSETND